MVQREHHRRTALREALTDGSDGAQAAAALAGFPLQLAPDSARRLRITLVLDGGVR
jgi:hypothetical protein